MVALRLQDVPGRYAVAQLEPGAEIPGWFNGPGFAALVRSEDETTLVCEAARIPEDVTAERNWACFRSIGPFAFDAAGIVSALVGPLAEAGIGVFVICTFDGEHLMVDATQLRRAKDMLAGAGHAFVA